MPNRVIIYGPPASGKSTILRSLASTCKHSTVIDLEQVAGSADFARQNRIALLQKLAALRFGGDLFIGAADIDPSDFPSGFQVVVLLYTDKAKYRARVDRRNTTQPDKAGQNEDRLFDAFTQVAANNPLWIHIDPGQFEGQCELMIQQVLNQLNS